MSLTHGPLPAGTLHLCIDMQNLLGPHSPWHAPWAGRVLPAIVALVDREPAATVFTRFVPPARLDELPGTWRNYYRRWEALMRDRIDPGLIELMGPLQDYVPPAVVLDKPVYSPFSGHRLAELLQARETEALVISGGETDVCVLATVLGAIDRGYRVVLASDALCSSVDQTHDAVLGFYSERLSHQVEVATAAEILEAWPRAR